MGQVLSCDNDHSLNSADDFNTLGKLMKPRALGKVPISENTSEIDSMSERNGLESC